jgi:mitochondrial chaperone BCS1
LTEDELETLFSNLPARCIVLLEDIDVVGLLRDIGEDSSQLALHNTADNNGVDTTISARALKRVHEDEWKGISLSGLLNVLDGKQFHIYFHKHVYANIEQELHHTKATF